MGEPATSEHDLILLAQSGDRSAFDALVLMHWKALMGAAMRVARSKERAEDTFQEGLSSVWENRERIDPNMGFVRWACRVVINAGISRLIRDQRRRMRFVSIGTLWSDDRQEERSPFREDAPDSPVYASQLRKLLGSCCNELKPMPRAIFVLTAAGWGHKEIARALTISIGNSRVLLFRARQYVRRCLEAKGIREGGLL